MDEHEVEISESSTSATIELCRADVMHLPRGVPHIAFASGPPHSISAHLTFMTFTPTLGEMLQHAAKLMPAESRNREASFTYSDLGPLIAGSEPEQWCATWNSLLMNTSARQRIIMDASAVEAALYGPEKWLDRYLQSNPRPTIAAEGLTSLYGESVLGYSSEMVHRVLEGGGQKVATLAHQIADCGYDVKDVLNCIGDLVALGALDFVNGPIAESTRFE